MVDKNMLLVAWFEGRSERDLSDFNGYLKRN